MTARGSDGGRTRLRLSNAGAYPAQEFAGTESRKGREASAQWHRKHWRGLSGEIW